jgi:putative transposase
MSNYRRIHEAGGTYFFTVVLQNRQNGILVEHIDLLRNAVRQVKQRRPFHIDAWVVLPDHIHAIWTLPPDDVDYSGRWREIKKAFVKALPATEWRSPVRQAKGERGIWQRRFWEHTIRDEADFQAHLDYVHINPLKHGWVDCVADWPYSTFHRYVAEGIYPANWAGTDKVLLLPYAD